jgi:hypothetical protein
VVTPHVTQFVLCEARREIRRRVTPGAALQGNHLEACIAKLLAHDGAGPTKSDQHGVDRFQGSRHDWLLGADQERLPKSANPIPEIEGVKAEPISTATPTNPNTPPGHVEIGSQRSQTSRSLQR